MIYTPLITKYCKTCGKKYFKKLTISKKEWKISKYCSRECFSKSILKAPLIVKCVGCGNDFKRDTRAGNIKRKYCSQECFKKYLNITKKINYNPNRHSNEKIKCACGCKTVINKYDSKGRLKKYAIGHTIKGKKRIFTKEWLEKLHKASIINGKNHSKEKHWNWKDGISTEEHLLRGTPQYNEWRKAVYKRDWWTCQECKIKQKNPVAHHLKSFSSHLKLRFNIDNGITLCRKCHMKIHKIKFTIGAS